jgi:hypothetical protein
MHLGACTPGPRILDYIALARSPALASSARARVSARVGMGLVPKTLLRLQRAVIIKAMPLRQHGASAVQCATIAAEIERRLPLLTAEYVHYRLNSPAPRNAHSSSFKYSVASPLTCTPWQIQ